MYKSSCDTGELFGVERSKPRESDRKLLQVSRREEATTEEEEKKPISVIF